MHGGRKVKKGQTTACTLNVWPLCEQMVISVNKYLLATVITRETEEVVRFGQKVLCQKEYLLNGRQEKNSFTTLTLLYIYCKVESTYSGCMCYLLTSHHYIVIFLPSSQLSIQFVSYDIWDFFANFSSPVFRSLPCRILSRDWHGKCDKSPSPDSESVEIPIRL